MNARWSLLEDILCLCCGITILFVLCGCGQLDEGSSPDPVIVPEREPVEYYPTSPSSSPPSTGNVMISESLKNGQTSGNYTGGTFTANGLQFKGFTWHLKYNVPTTPNGYIEFNARGFVPQERHHGNQNFKGYLITMWDDSRPFDHDTNPYIFQMFKYGYIAGRPDATDCFFFAVISQGQFSDSLDHGYYVLDWNPKTTYRIRLELGSGQARVYRDNAYIGSVEYYGTFSPRSHAIQIGANLNNIVPGRRKEGPRDLLISDVVLGTL